MQKSNQRASCGHAWTGQRVRLARRGATQAPLTWANGVAWGSFAGRLHVIIHGLRASASSFYVLDHALGAGLTLGAAWVQSHRAWAQQPHVNAQAVRQFGQLLVYDLANLSRNVHHVSWIFDQLRGCAAASRGGARCWDWGQQQQHACTEAKCGEPQCRGCCGGIITPLC